MADSIYIMENYHEMMVGETLVRIPYSYLLRKEGQNGQQWEAELYSYIAKTYGQPVVDMIKGGI
jgi:hypothetical protein